MQLGGWVAGRWVDGYEWHEQPGSGRGGGREERWARRELYRGPRPAGGVWGSNWACQETGENGLMESGRDMGRGLLSEGWAAQPIHRSPSPALPPRPPIPPSSASPPTTTTTALTAILCETIESKLGGHAAPRIAQEAAASISLLVALPIRTRHTYTPIHDTTTHARRLHALHTSNVIPPYYMVATW